MLLLGSTWRRRLESFQIVVVIGIMIVIWKICYESIQWPKMPAYYNSISDDESGAGNATLGFEAIIVVAPNKSTGGETVWRQDGLLQAADLTGLKVLIPPQPNFTMEEILNSIVEDRRKEIIEQMQNGTEGEFTDAEGRLRLGHLHVLKLLRMYNRWLYDFPKLPTLFDVVEDSAMPNSCVMERGYSSALILEDDADWDVAIRSQAPAVANAIRDLTDGVVGPWGFNWDYLALGHCGAGAVPDDKYRVIQDNTTGPVEDFIALWPPEKDLKPHTRFVHKSAGTVCTFGYAVSRQGASKLIDRLSTSGLPLDIDYATFCGSGGLNCYAVTPEIIHHQRWTGKKITSGGTAHGALEEGETEQIFTINIKNSARCNSKPDVVKSRASGTEREWIRCLPTGLAKTKYPTKK